MIVTLPGHLSFYLGVICRRCCVIVTLPGHLSLYLGVICRQCHVILALPLHLSFYLGVVGRLCLLLTDQTGYCSCESSSLGSVLGSVFVYYYLFMFSYYNPQLSSIFFLIAETIPGYLCVL